MHFFPAAPPAGRVEPLTALFLALVGVGVGFISTLYGVGGGILIVPTLFYAFAVPFKEATMVSLAAITVPTPFGVHQHLRRSAVSWRLATQLAVGGAVGVAAGTWLQPRLEVTTLRYLMAGAMAVAAWRLVQPEIAPREAHTASPVLVVGLGVVAGVTSKLLGIGGGLVTVPALALAGIPMHLAVGSSLVPVFTNAAIGTATAVATKSFDWTLAIPLALGALCGVPLGAKVAHGLKALTLRRVFAGGMVAAAVYVALSG